MMGYGLWIKIGLAAVALGGLALSHTAAYRAGRSAEQAAFIERINMENDDAGEASEDWRGKLRRCIDAGGVFDFEAGSCEP